MRFSPAALGAACPDLVLGVVFLLVWLEPERFAPDMIRGFMLLMLLEFIVVHSGGFAGSVMLSDKPRMQKVQSLGLLGGFYTLFVGGFSLAFHTWWPLLSFWGLMVNRMMSVLLGQAEKGDERAFLQRGWAAGAVFYLCFIFATVLLPVPRFGVTDEVLRAVDLPGEGLWVDQPWRVLAFGFLYFTATGLSEMRGHEWFAGGVPARQSKAA